MMNMGAWRGMGLFAFRPVAFAAACAFVFALGTPAAVADSQASGVWRAKNGKVTIRLSACGGEKLCGRIVALSKPRGKDGKLKRDKKNPNAALRNRPVIGVTILSGLKPEGANAWSGSIYNPDDGNTYRSKVKLVSPTRLKVNGCVSVVCKSMDFYRVN